MSSSARKSATYRKTFARTLHQIDLALLVREMREDAGLTQAGLARKVGTTQSVIARLEDAEYTGHSLTMLERIAAVCGVALKLHAGKEPHFDREVALVYYLLFFIPLWERITRPSQVSHRIPWRPSPVPSSRER
jgi:transcriptional regulator with XRE-family HTH domain